MRHITQEGLSLIKQYEGFSVMPYECPAGYLTIGYGHVVKSGEDFARGVTVAQATQLLRLDVHIAEKAVLKYIDVPLLDNQFDALVSFTFNVGGGALQRSTLRRKINRLHYGDVPNELMRWVYAGGRRLTGLITRRQAEARHYAMS